MIKLTVDEAYAFDYYSILQLKYENGYISEKIIQQTRDDIYNSLDHSLIEKIMCSKEYAQLLNANRITFEAVDRAKTDDVLASYVDKCNYERMLAKKELQSKFFNNSISETKIGYDKLNKK